MEVRACKNCRRLFHFISGPELCPECRKLVIQERVSTDKKLSAAIKPMLLEDEEKYEKVKDYILTHPNATIALISEVNEIPPSKLFEWIRDDRLEFTDTSKNAWFECEVCGSKIKSGRVCYSCKQR